MCENCAGSKFLSLVNSVPVVRSALEKTSNAYSAVKETNMWTKLGFGATEMSLSVAVTTTKFAFQLLPSFGVLGTLREKIDKRVGQVDSLACCGLEYVQKVCPIIMEDIDQIVEKGIEIFEESVVAEVLLVVGETFLEHIQPDHDSDDTEAKPNEAGNYYEINRNSAEAPTTGKADQPTKLHRAKRVSKKAEAALQQTVIPGGKKALYFAVSVPGMITRTGLYGAKFVLKWTLGTIITSRGEKLRRSKRVKKPVDYRQFLSASACFQLEKKRKRNSENSDEDSATYELLNVDDSYVSEEDPDFNPADEDIGNDTTEEESGEGSLEGDELNDITGDCDIVASHETSPRADSEEREPAPAADPGMIPPEQLEERRDIL